MRSEVDKDGGLVLDADDVTQAVLIMCHQVSRGESLDWAVDDGDGDVEGASRQRAPSGPGA